MAEWSNSFVLVPNTNGKVRLYLDQANSTKYLSGQSIEGLHLMTFSKTKTKKL